MNQNEQVIQVDPVQAVKQHIYRQMREGLLKDGDRLPSEISLSQQLDIPRNTVREALQSLKSIGLLNSVRGSGYILSPNFDYSLADVLHAMMSVSETSRQDINQVREALDKKAISMLLQSEKLEDVLTILERLVLNMERHSILGEKLDPRVCVNADREFHREIALSTKNTFMRAFNTSLNQHYDGFVALQWDQLGEEETENLINCHRKLIRQMRKGNLDGSMAAVEEHYKIAEEIISGLNRDETEELKEIEKLIQGLQKKGFSNRQIQEKLKELS